VIRIVPAVFLIAGDPVGPRLLDSTSTGPSRSVRIAIHFVGVLTMGNTLQTVEHLNTIQP